jgi:hypothetical protein
MNAIAAAALQQQSKNANVTRDLRNARVLIIGAGYVARFFIK